MIHFDEKISDWVGNPPPNNLDNPFPLVGASFFAVKPPADGLRYQKISVNFSRFFGVRNLQGTKLSGFFFVTILLQPGHRSLFKW